MGMYLSVVQGHLMTIIEKGYLRQMVLLNGRMTLIAESSESELISITYAKSVFFFLFVVEDVSKHSKISTKSIVYIVLMKNQNLKPSKDWCH